MLTDIRLELAKAIEHREACDALLRSYYSGVEASDLKPIQGWMGRYGKRGALAEAILNFLASAGLRKPKRPQEVAEELCRAAPSRFDDKWQRRTVA